MPELSIEREREVSGLREALMVGELTLKEWGLAELCDDIGDLLDEVKRRPTRWAYERACEALAKWRERFEAVERKLLTSTDGEPLADDVTLPVSEIRRLIAEIRDPNA